MDERTDPYRTVRVVTTDDATPLPALIGAPFERLVAQKRRTWETEQAPPWWQVHVDAHEAPRAYWRAEDLRPKPVRLLYSVAWTTLLLLASVAVAIMVKAWHRETIFLAYLTAAVAGGVYATERSEKDHADLLDERGMPFTAAKQFSSRRAIRYVAIAPLSLYLCGKEAVAWILWRRAGRAWTAEPWDEERVGAELFSAFEADVIGAHRAAHLQMQAAATRDRQRSGELATLAETERRRFEEHRIRQATLSKHFERAYLHAQARADQLNRRARELEGLAIETGNHLETLVSLTAQYRALQGSLRELRAADSLPTDDVTDLELRTQMGSAHRAILECRRQTEALLQPTPTRAAEDAHELAAHEPVLKAAGPHS